MGTRTHTRETQIALSQASQLEKWPDYGQTCLTSSNNYGCTYNEIVGKITMLANSILLIMYNCVLLWQALITDVHAHYWGFQIFGISYTTEILVKIVHVLMLGGNK